MDMLDLCAITCDSLLRKMNKEAPKGVSFCTGGIRDALTGINNCKVEVQVHTGIKILAEYMEKELFNPLDLDGEVFEDRLAILSNGVMYFQLAHEERDGTLIWY